MLFPWDLPCAYTSVNSMTYPKFHTSIISHPRSTRVRPNSKHQTLERRAHAARKTRTDTWTTFINPAATDEGLPPTMMQVSEQMVVGQEAALLRKSTGVGSRRRSRRAQSVKQVPWISPTLLSHSGAFSGNLIWPTQTCEHRLTSLALEPHGRVPSTRYLQQGVVSLFPGCPS